MSVVVLVVVSVVCVSELCVVDEEEELEEVEEELVSVEEDVVVVCEEEVEDVGCVTVTVDCVSVSVVVSVLQELPSPPQTPHLSLISPSLSHPVNCGMSKSLFKYPAISQSINC